MMRGSLFSPSNFLFLETWSSSFFRRQSSHIYFSFLLQSPQQQSRQNGFVASPTTFSFLALQKSFLSSVLSAAAAPPGAPVITEGKSSSFSFPFSSRSLPPLPLFRNIGAGRRKEERERERERAAGRERRKRGIPPPPPKGEVEV